MQHQLKENGSVHHILRNELTPQNLHAGALHGNGRSELLMQTKQINEVQFLEQTIPDGLIPGTKQADV